MLHQIYDIEHRALRISLGAIVMTPQDPAIFYKILLPSPHFEKSRVPLVLPKYLPHDWKGGLVLLGVVWILSSFLDNIAGALIGGALTHQLFRAKVCIGYVAVIVATSNTGGAWSVLGDRK
jgi:hypothetical protein